MLSMIPVDLIEPGTRLRGISEAQVEALIDSVAEVGIINPVTVYRRNVIRDAVAVEGYGLVAGLHRVEVCKRLGLVEIPAQIVDMSDLRRQLAECDENLCGTVLSKAERALFTRRRKEIYVALHPETAHGENQHTRSRKVCDSSDEDSADRFTADTAKATGRSERAVQLDVERGRIAEDVLAMVQGSPLDKGTYLDSIKKLSPEGQRERVELDLARVRENAAEARRRAPAKLAPEPLNDFETKERWLAAGLTWWNKGSQEWREEFLARIDKPVFDNARSGEPDLTPPPFLDRRGRE